MKGYRIFGPTYEAVCEHLGWDAAIKPVAVRQGVRHEVLVTGTALKPEEWRELLSHTGDVIADGRTIKVVHCPAEILGRTT